MRDLQERYIDREIQVTNEYIDRTSTAVGILKTLLKDLEHGGQYYGLDAKEEVKKALEVLSRGQNDDRN